MNAIRWLSLDNELKENQKTINKLQLEVEAFVADQRKIDADTEKHLSDNAELTDELSKVQARFYSLVSSTRYKMLDDCACRSLGETI